MTGAKLSDLTDCQRDQAEALLVEFDANWQPNMLATWVSAKLPAEQPLRRWLLAELVAVDMERQWQCDRRLALGSYLERFPELGTPASVSAELILAECQVRQQFGEPVDAAELARRYPEQAAEVLRRLHAQGGQSLAALSIDPSASAAAHDTSQAGLASDTLGGPRAVPDRGAIAAPSAPFSNDPGQQSPLPESPIQASVRSARELSGTFGRYTILKKLDQGGMGAVYLAHDTQLDRQVALKVPHFAPQERRTVVDRFLREARAMATIRHPHLCPVYDAGEIDGIQYLTMAFIEGHLLSEYIKADEPAPERRVAAMVRKLALALQEAHALGIIHRDLKPKNIFVDQRGEPVVLDFGLARREETHDATVTQPGAVLGTPAYMAPEQARGRQDAVGPCSDIYSLGVILYEMLTGRPPFRGDNVLQVLSQVMTSDAEPPRTARPDLDPRLEAICLKAMAKRPEDRYASMAEFAAVLTEFLKQRSASVAAPPSPPVVPQDPPAVDKPRPNVVRLSTRPRPAAWHAMPAALRRVPPRIWIATGIAGLAAVLCGIILLLPTRHGLVKIELSDPTAEVEVRVDGERIGIGGLDKLLRFTLADHQLVVTGDEFETVTRSFTAKRDGIETVRVTLVPKAEPAQPAVITVELEPADAMLTVSGEGATVSGQGGRRIVKVVRADGERRILLLATKPGYEPLQRELQPAAADSQSLTLVMQPVPAPPPAEVAKAQPAAEPKPAAEPPAPEPRPAVPDVPVQVAEAARGPLPTITNSIGMRMALVPAGEFLMGSANSDSDASSDEKPQHRVRITKPFYLGICEVTQAEYQWVMGTNPSEFKADGGQLPVEQVSWNDAQEFCRKLSALPEERQAGVVYRLPTEAEWEYACRAGTTSRYAFDEPEESLVNYAWYKTNSDSKTHPVGTLKPNAWGLYDMHGNVWEWCQDWYDAEYYGTSPIDDPRGPAEGSDRVNRGGSWYYDASHCRSAYRSRLGPGYRRDFRGFRLVRTVTP